MVLNQVTPHHDMNPVGVLLALPDFSAYPGMCGVFSPLGGTSFCPIKNTVSVPATSPGMPCWASLPSSCDIPLSQTFLCWGRQMSCRYSSISPVSLPRTPPAHWHNAVRGEHLVAHCFGVTPVRALASAQCSFVCDRVRAVVGVRGWW